MYSPPNYFIFVQTKKMGRSTERSKGRPSQPTRKKGERISLA